MKKKIFAAIVIASLLAGIYLIGSGFIKNTSAFISDYRVSADGRELTIHMGVSSSAGFIRDVKVHQQQGGKMYLDCYSVFGGINGRWGAKDTFTFSLEEDTSVIAVYRASNCYEEALTKTADGVWQRAGQ